MSGGLRILYVITSLRFGGAEKLVVDLSLRLKREGHYVEVFLMDGTETPLTRILEDNGILLHKISRGYSQMWNPLHFKKLKTLLQNKQFDIVHTHNTPAQIIAYLTKQKLKSNIKFITTEHNTYNRRRSIPLLKGFDRKMYQLYDKVVCVSEATRDNLVRYLSSPEVTDKFITIYNGIDFSKFHIESTEKPNGYQDKKIVLMVAAFRKQKDHPTLIRALTHLPENYIVWLAGEGVRRKKCENLVRKTGLENRVKFLGDRPDVSRLYSMADIVVLSSCYEGMSLSSIEALNSGKPFIASNVDGLREIVHGAGLLFEQGDDKDLAQKILMIGENEDLGLKISETCKNRAQSFDFDETYSRYRSVYYNLCKNDYSNPAKSLRQQDDQADTLT